MFALRRHHLQRTFNTNQEELFMSLIRQISIATLVLGLTTGVAFADAQQSQSQYQSEGTILADNSATTAAPATTGAAPAKATTTKKVHHKKHHHHSHHAVKKADASNNQVAQANSGHFGTVNINTADASSLQGAGIDANTAKEIVAYREQNGPYNSVEELSQVKGISPSVFNQIKSQLTTG